MELTLRSWIYTQESKRRTMQKNDVIAAMTNDDFFDFLIDILPSEHFRMRKLEASNISLQNLPTVIYRNVPYFTTNLPLNSPAMTYPLSILPHVPGGLYPHVNLNMNAEKLHATTNYSTSHYSPDIIYNNLNYGNTNCPMTRFPDGSLNVEEFNTENTPINITSVPLNLANNHSIVFNHSHTQ
jgi:hypothetical protein